MELRSLPDAKAIIAAKKQRFRDALEERLPKVNKVYWQMAEELSEVFDPLAVMAAMLDMKFYKELLPENYPALSKGRQERQFGSMHGTHRDNSPENDRRRNRRRSRRNDYDNAEESTGETRKRAPRSEKQERSGKEFSGNKTENFDRGSRKSRSGKPANDFAKPERERSQNNEKPRKKLRDWALDLTENTKDMPRYKNKKRK